MEEAEPSSLPPAPSPKPQALCFHCNEPLNGSTITATIENRKEPVCCIGCRAVAELIAGAGLGDYYKYREQPGQRPNVTTDPWSAYERPEIASQFTQLVGERASVVLLIEGLRCAACSWLIDKVLLRSQGVLEVSVNAAVGRAEVQWDPARTNLARVLRDIAALGYQPHPLTDANAARAKQDESRLALKRLAVAGLGMMQVMMFAVATYSADLAGEVMSADIWSYFRIVSMLVSTPVMLYSGAPILLGAWRSLRLRTVGMDVPVSIALLLAYGASVLNTWRGTGAVYFDSVTMFIFFLTLGRWVEMAVRHRTAGITDALARHLPATAHKLIDDRIEDVATAQLACDDVVLVRSGETVPADAVIVDGEAHVDESMLTGESLPVRRAKGEHVNAGTLNVGSPVRARVVAVGGATLLSGIVALLQRAQTQKPALAQAANQAAARFLQAVLAVSAIVCAAWLALDPSRAFEATLAVLVVACPCAFAIAMPAALAAATGELARHGVLVTRPNILESLAKLDRVIFDKTGTLTRGELCIEHIDVQGRLSAADCEHIAAALEQQSEHPIARAFAGIASTRTATDVITVSGAGVEAHLDDVRYRLGSQVFAAELKNDPHPVPLPQPGEGTLQQAMWVSSPPPVAGEGTLQHALRMASPPPVAGEGTLQHALRMASPPPVAGEGTLQHALRVASPLPVAGEVDAVAAGEGPSQQRTRVTLADEHGVLAHFILGDTLRAESTHIAAQLQALNINAEILSGDALGAVTAVAQQCGIPRFQARCTPERKLEHLRELQAKGLHVAMLGDGINDAPVLGAADVSIAMGKGAALAHATADLILIGENLNALPHAIRTARKTLRIAKQNLYWAAAYNFGSLPLAALGFIPPWLAALGMSVSSVAVILNATRLMSASRAKRGPKAFGSRPEGRTVLLPHASTLTPHTPSEVST